MGLFRQTSLTLAGSLKHTYTLLVQKSLFAQTMITKTSLLGQALLL